MSRKKKKPAKRLEGGSRQIKSESKEISKESEVHFIESLIGEGLITSDTLAKVDGSVPQNTMVGGRPAMSDIPTAATQPTQMQPSPQAPAPAAPASSPEPEPEPEQEEPKPEEEPEETEEEPKQEESFDPANATLKLAEYFLGEMEKSIKEDGDERSLAIREARKKLKFILDGLVGDDDKEQEMPPRVEPEEESEDFPAASRFLEWATESKKDKSFKVDRLSKLFNKIPKDKIEKVVSDLESNKIVKRDAILKEMQKIFSSKE